MKQPDPAEFRLAVSRFTTGVTVITCRDQDAQIVGMTASSFTSVSLSPPTLLVSILRGRTLNAIERSGRFGVNVLPASARDISSHFAGRTVPGLVPRFDETSGMPKLGGTIGYFDCDVDKSFVVADHTLLIGSVKDCCYGDAEPLVIFSSQYHNLVAESGVPTS